MKRVITAALLIPFIAWVTLASPQWVFLLVLAITGLLAYHEFDQIAAAGGSARAGLPGMLCGLVLLVAPQPAVVLVLIAMLGMTLAMRVNDFRASLPAAGAFTLGIAYVFGAWRCAADLRAERIEPLGAVQGRNGDARFDARQDLVGHVSDPPRPRRPCVRPGG